MVRYDRARVSHLAWVVFGRRSNSSRQGEELSPPCWGRCHVIVHAADEKRTTGMRKRACDERAMSNKVGGLLP
jgi:hypothetical protein